MADYSRAQRVADLIQKEVAILVQRGIKDPSLPSLVTITHVEVTKDFSSAKVYFTLLGDTEKLKIASEILNHAAGYLRTCLSKTIKLRTVPQLKYIYDQSIAYGSHLSGLIDGLNQPE